MKPAAEGDGVSPAKPAEPGRDATVPSKEEITRWLTACKTGDPAALEKLLPLVYDELHRLAVRAFNRERAGHTLQPTALVDEAYLRLVNQREAHWQNRAQFFSIAAQIMRRILVITKRQNGAVPSSALSSWKEWPLRHSAT